MQHIRETLVELRRYIAASESRVELEEVDALLAVAVEEVRRKLAISAVHDNENREQLSQEAQPRTQGER